MRLYSLGIYITSDNRKLLKDIRDAFPNKNDSRIIGAGIIYQYPLITKDGDGNTVMFGRVRFKHGHLGYRTEIMDKIKALLGDFKECSKPSWVGEHKCFNEDGNHDGCGFTSKIEKK